MRIITPPVFAGGLGHAHGVAGTWLPETGPLHVARRIAGGGVAVVVLGWERLDSRRAADVLRKVFSGVTAGCAFRLWDGTQVSVGQGEPRCTAVIPRRETFVRLLRDPTPLNFAEAYVEGAIEIEGDLFAAMEVANAIEEIRIPLADRLKILFALWRH